MNSFCLKRPLSTGPWLVKLYADKCSHLFWERLAGDTSLGICEHSLFGITAPANPLFWVDKVLHEITSALISNSPFWPPPQFQVGDGGGGGEERTWNREKEGAAESEDKRSYREEISKDNSNFFNGVSRRWRLVRQWGGRQQEELLPLGWRDRGSKGQG